MLDDQFEILKYIVTFTLTVAFRASIRTQIPSLVYLIRKALENNVRLSLWLIEIFANQRIIKEFFVDCTITDMSRFTAGLLKTAMTTVFQHEQENLREYTSQLEKGSIVDYIIALPGDWLFNHSDRKSSHLNQSAAMDAQNAAGTSSGDQNQHMRNTI